MEKELQQLKEQALAEFALCKTKTELSDLKVKVLGKKGSLTASLRNMGNLSPEERPKIGQVVNNIRQELEDLFNGKEEALNEEDLKSRLASEQIDITLPGRRYQQGHLHPITLVMNRIKDIFMRLGFEICDGPEIEKDYYNFELMNLPKDHPARDAQDSFYFSDEFLLRTHTSPVQARVLQANEPNTPIRMIAPGKVYRRDYDATHSPMFHQVEGLVVDTNISFSDLKGTLELFLKEIFGSSVKIRLRPSFFPFTEPSAEVDISCVICSGKGCRVCKGSGWLEILGSGVIHPNVLQMSGYDPEKINGFAFGMGVERIAMLLYGIDDLRLYFENNMRFVRQFN